jgi:sec-independent protein translocase protein TatA
VYKATGKVPRMSFGPTELIIVLLIVLLLFGGAKLPKLARSLGEASKEFKKGVEDKDKEESKDDGKTAS